MVTTSLNNLNNGPGQPTQGARVIAVTSGKGGVGKTNISANLAITLATRGARVCLLDADSGMANINVLLGFTPSQTLEDIISGDCGLDEVLVKGPRGIDIVPAVSGIADGMRLDGEKSGRLIQALQRLEADYDYLLIDTAAGAGENVLHFLRAAQHIMLVITPDPTSLTNAFGLLKIMKNRGMSKPVHVLLNRLPDYPRSVNMFNRFRAAADKHLGLHPIYMGFMAEDPMLAKAVQLQRPVVLLQHDAPSSRCFYTLAEAVDKHLGNTDASFTDYWQQLATQSASPASVLSEADAVSPEADEAPVSKASIIEAAGQLAELLGASEIDKKTAAQSIEAVVTAFQDRFGHSPFDLKRQLLRELERKDYPAEDIRTLASTLEAMHIFRHQKPLHDFESAISQFVAGAHDNPAAFKEALHYMKESYQRRFGEDPFDSRATDSSNNEITKVHYLDEKVIAQVSE